MMGAMGYISAIVLVAFLLPLGAFLYLDILEAKNETKRMLEKIEKIEVYSVDGKLLKTTSENNKVDFSQYGKGLYIIKMYTKSGVHTQKIIK